jgi:hypothetical protein
VPVLVAHPGTDPEVHRVVLSLTHHDLTPAGTRTLDLAVDIATRMASQAEVGLVVLTPDPPDLVRTRLVTNRVADVWMIHDERAQPIALRDRTRPGDLVVTGVPPTGGRLSQRAIRIGRAVRSRTLVVVVPH